MASFENLPPELVHRISGHLSEADKSRLGSSSRQLRAYTPKANPFEDLENLDKFFTSMLVIATLNDRAWSDSDREKSKSILESYARHTKTSYKYLIDNESPWKKAIVESVVKISNIIEENRSRIYLHAMNLTYFPIIQLMEKHIDFVLDNDGEFLNPFQGLIQTRIDTNGWLVIHMGTTLDETIQKLNKL